MFVYNNHLVSSFFFKNVFQVSEGTNIVLQHNIVAGYERVAYRIDGEPCPGDIDDFNQQWQALCLVLVQISSSFRTVNYRTSSCAGYINDNEAWIHNEAHGGLFGVYLNNDGLPGCAHIQGFFVWRSFDYGIYFQVLKTKSLLPTLE